jgi:23S rRNA pseudouridine1911/1915/1917 synthase
MPEREPLRPRHVIRPNGAEQIVVPPFGAHMRLDAFLARYGDTRSRTEWRRLIDGGGITLDGKRVRPSDRLTEGQRIQVAPATVPTSAPIPRASGSIPLTILYEDPAMIVVNKPPGLVVHPGPGHEDGTLVNALLALYPDLADPSGEQRPGIVHRLDKDTSGLIVIGRTTAAMGALQQQFKERSARKKYLLLVQGDLADEQAAIEVPIGRDQHDRTRMAGRTGGRESRTQFVVLERYGDFTLVEADLQTGRTHQLRVHFQYINHPVAGDKTYGAVRGPVGLRRQFVHACSMLIRSPHDNRELQFYAPLPADLRSPLERHRAIRGFSADSLPEQIVGGKNPPGVHVENIPNPNRARRAPAAALASAGRSTPSMAADQRPDADERPAADQRAAANAPASVPGRTRPTGTARPKRGPNQPRAARPAPPRPKRGPRT